MNKKQFVICVIMVGLFLGTKAEDTKEKEPVVNSQFQITDHTEKIAAGAVAVLVFIGGLYYWNVCGDDMSDELIDAHLDRDEEGDTELDNEYEFAPIIENEKKVVLDKQNFVDNKVDDNEEVFLDDDQNKDDQEDGDRNFDDGKEEESDFFVKMEAMREKTRKFGSKIADQANSEFTRAKEYLTSEEFQRSVVEIGMEYVDVVDNGMQKVKNGVNNAVDYFKQFNKWAKTLSPKKKNKSTKSKNVRSVNRKISYFVGEGQQNFDTAHGQQSGSVRNENIQEEKTVGVEVDNLGDEAKEIIVNEPAQDEQVTLHKPETDVSIEYVEKQEEEIKGKDNQEETGDLELDMMNPSGEHEKEEPIDLCVEDAKKNTKTIKVPDKIKEIIDEMGPALPNKKGPKIVFYSRDKLESPKLKEIDTSVPKLAKNQNTMKTGKDLQEIENELDTLQDGSKLLNNKNILIAGGALTAAGLFYFWNKSK